MMCESCGAYVDPNSREIFLTAYPDIPDHMHDWARKIDEERGTPRKPCLYHRRKTDRRSYHLTKTVVCGPLRKETDAEYYIRWATGG